jgi:hypothetical protein
MMDIDLAKTRFKQALNDLVMASPLSLKAIKEAARRNGIGYSTLQSWRSGQHLPQVPEDNRSLRDFLHEIAATPAAASEVMTLATQAWRTYVQAKKRAGSSRRAAGTATGDPASKRGGAVAIAEPDDWFAMGWDDLPAPSWAARGWPGWRRPRGWGRCGW